LFSEPKYADGYNVSIVHNLEGVQDSHAESPTQRRSSHRAAPEGPVVLAGAVLSLGVGLIRAARRA
jgi:hypothetical protein